MKVRIEKDAQGKDVLWTEVGGEHGGKAKPVPLPVENIFFHAATGHVFTTFPGNYRGKTLERLRPHEVEMVEFWLRERASEITTLVFAGEPPLG